MNGKQSDNYYIDLEWNAFPHLVQLIIVKIPIFFLKEETGWPFISDDQFTVNKLLFLILASSLPG